MSYVIKIDNSYYAGNNFRGEKRLVNHKLDAVIFNDYLFAKAICNSFECGELEVL